MDGVERHESIWRTVKRRLRFNALSCCGGPSWSLTVSNLSPSETEAIHEEAQFTESIQPGPIRSMSLAAALSRESSLRSVGPADQLKTLMSLFEETDGGDERKSNWYMDGGIDGLCCVCMDRNRGAAFIPCGHTYCRVCSRELWLNRMFCPLCNRSINNILDIF